MVALAVVAFVISVIIALVVSCGPRREAVPVIVVGVVLAGAIAGGILYGGNVLLRKLSNPRRGKPR
jgi:hypothetical protein